MNVVTPTAKLFKKYLVKENDTLFTRTKASTAKTYLYNKNDRTLYFDGFLIRARVNEENDSKFVFIQTLTEKYNKWVKVTSIRSRQLGINSKEYASFYFIDLELKNNNE